MKIPKNTIITISAILAALCIFFYIFDSCINYVSNYPTFGRRYQLKLPAEEVIERIKRIKKFAPEYDNKNTPKELNLDFNDTEKGYYHMYHFKVPLGDTYFIANVIVYPDHNNPAELYLDSVDLVGIGTYRTFSLPKKERIVVETAFEEHILDKIIHPSKLKQGLPENSHTVTP